MLPKTKNATNTKAKMALIFIWLRLVNSVKYSNMDKVKSDIKIIPQRVKFRIKKYAVAMPQQRLIAINNTGRKLKSFFIRVFYQNFSFKFYDKYEKMSILLLQLG